MSITLKILQDISMVFSARFLWVVTQPFALWVGKIPSIIANDCVLGGLFLKCLGVDCPWIIHSTLWSNFSKRNFFTLWILSFEFWFLWMPFLYKKSNCGSLCIDGPFNNGKSTSSFQIIKSVLSYSMLCITWLMTWKNFGLDGLLAYCLVAWKRYLRKSFIVKTA